MSDNLGELGDAADVVLVTFAPSDQLDAYQDRRRLGFPILVDADRSTYAAYGLDRGGFAQVWGWSTMKRYVEILSPSGPGHIGDLSGSVRSDDTRQLGGDMVIAPDGTLAWGHWSTGPADRPSVDAIAAAVGRAAS